MVTRTGGTAELVDSNDGYPRPLGNALSHADRRLRVAAAQAIARLDPQHDFPGASRVTDALAFVAGTSAVPKVLVVEPRAERAQTVAGLAAELGFEGETAFTGRQAIKQALTEPDYAFVLISDAGEEVLRAGDCAGFKAGIADGHHLQNRSNAPATVLEIGSRRPAEDVPLAELLEALDGPFHLAECNKTEPDPCSHSGACTVKGAIAEVHRRIRDLLSNVTLAEIFRRPAGCGSSFEPELLALESHLLVRYGE